MSVDSCIVRSGFYKNELPALINIEIIEYLGQINPIPPDAIVREALEAENRIFKS